AVKRGLRMAYRWHTAHGEAFPILRCATPYFGKRPCAVAAATAASGRPSRLHGGEQIFAWLVVETVRRLVGVRVEPTHTIALQRAYNPTTKVASPRESLPQITPGDIATDRIDQDRSVKHLCCDEQVERARL